MKPSEERVWMKNYPEQIKFLQPRKESLLNYVKSTVKDMNAAAIHFYGRDISFAELFETTERVARALTAYGISKGDQVIVYLQSVPAYLPILFAADLIGASIVSRDGTIEQEAVAIQKSNAKIAFIHSDIETKRYEAYKTAGVSSFVLVNKEDYIDSLPEYIKIDSANPEILGISFNDFINGKQEEYIRNSDFDIPLLRIYTTGTTGDAKQVIHSSSNIVNLLMQMNLFSIPVPFRMRWLCSIIPPSLVATVVSLILFPLCANMIVILDPYCDVNDVDLAIMNYKPNGWNCIPCFVDVILESKRITDDYDASHFIIIGTGAELLNKKKFRHMQGFLRRHNCKARFGSGYGLSEACSTILFSTPNMDRYNYGYGIPMPLSLISIFKENTDEELDYGEVGEICINSPCLMLGYDTEEETNKVIKTHSDGIRWLHTGDIGLMTKKGLVYIFNRGHCKHYTGGNLFVSFMENKVIDIDGIKDAFFVTVPDKNHSGFFLPYMYVILEDGYSIDDIEPILPCILDAHELPVEIFALKERPIFHFKTARKILAKEIMDKCNSSCT